MKLENCGLQIAGVVTPPLIRTEPEPDWVTARDTGILPAAGFSLYSRSNYFSYGSAPPFLADENHLLFTYFGMVLRSVRESLVDADAELRAFLDSQAHIYDPGKRVRGEEWDPSAPKQAKIQFRLLLSSLYSVLDTTADLVSLFLTGLIPRLHLGKAKFSHIEEWLGRPFPPSGLIITPQRSILERLYADLLPLIKPSGPECDWLPFMRMIRNKAAHLGDEVFRYVALPDQNGIYYTFIPRQWPFILEEHVYAADTIPSPPPEPFPEFLRRTLIHEDISSYSSGLRKKVTEVVEKVLAVLDSAYVQFCNFSLNTAALAELNECAASHSFNHFNQ
jgi:hypothetical protein